MILVNKNRDLKLCGISSESMIDFHFESRNGNGRRLAFANHLDHKLDRQS
jgi:hypothetical protein